MKDRKRKSKPPEQSELLKFDTTHTHGLLATDIKFIDWFFQQQITIQCDQAVKVTSQQGISKGAWIDSWTLWIFKVQAPGGNKKLNKR